MADDPRLLELADRVKRLESALNDVPLYQLAVDTRVLPAESVELISSESVAGSTRVAIRWIRPSDANIDHFEIWVKRTAFDAETPYLIAAVADSPSAFTVAADRDTVAVAYIRTFLKNGLSTDLNTSPTVTFQVYVSLGSESVTDPALDRSTTNKVQIRSSDIISLDPAKISPGAFTGCSLTYAASGVTTSVKNEWDTSDYVGLKVKRTANPERITVSPKLITLYDSNNAVQGCLSQDGLNLINVCMVKVILDSTTYGMGVLGGVGGSYYLWIDSSGRLRIKLNAPTTDTDGTVVGTQT